MQLKLMLAHVLVGLLTLSSVAVTTALPIGLDDVQREYAQYFRRQIRQPTDPPLCPQPKPGQPIWKCPPRRDEMPEGRAVSTTQPLEDGINHWTSRDQPPKLSSRVDLDNAAQIDSRLDENLNALHDDKARRAVDGKQAGQSRPWEERSTAESTTPAPLPPSEPCGTGEGQFKCKPHPRHLDGPEALYTRNLNALQEDKARRAVDGKQAGQARPREERSTAEDNFPWIHLPPAPCGSGGGTYQCKSHPRHLDGPEALYTRNLNAVHDDKSRRAVDGKQARQSRPREERSTVESTTPAPLPPSEPCGTGEGQFKCKPHPRRS